MAGGSQIIISSDGITIKTPREFKVFAGQHIFTGPSVASVKATHLQHLLPSSNEVPKAKISPNVHLPIMGVLASLQRLDGKLIQESDDIKINGTKLKEVWIAKNGIAYFVPLKNIPQIQSIEINGESLKLDNNLRHFNTNRECIDSILKQFDVINEAIKEHKKNFGDNNVSWIMVQGLCRYKSILYYIEELKMDLEDQKYLIDNIKNNKLQINIWE